MSGRSIRTVKHPHFPGPERPPPQPYLPPAARADYATGGPDGGGRPAGPRRLQRGDGRRWCLGDVGVSGAGPDRPAGRTVREDAASVGPGAFGEGVIDPWTVSSAHRARLRATNYTVSPVEETRDPDGRFAHGSEDHPGRTERHDRRSHRGRRHPVVDTARRRRGRRGPRNASFVAHVDPTGLVRDYRLAYTARDRGRTERVIRTVEYDGIGETRIERPAWVDRAANETGVRVDPG